MPIRRWPTWAEKQVTLTRLGVSLFPNQEAASHYLCGTRSVPSVVQIIGGERAGKSDWAGNEMTCLMPWCKLIYIAGAGYENTHPEYEYLEDNLRRLGALEKPLKPKMGAWSLETHWGEREITRVETISFSKQGSDALIATGKAPDLIVLCEAGLLEEAEFIAAYTRVAERRGAVLAIGTLKRSKPWYVALYRQLQQANDYNGKSFSFPSWQNTVIYPGGEHDPAINALRNALGPTRFIERIGAEPVPSPLLVFGQEFDYNLHVKKCYYEPELPIGLACDPGYAGAYALLVIQTPSSSEVRVIDEFYEQYATWDKCVDWLRSRPYIKQTEQGWLQNINRAVMDIAGTAHHGDRSQVEQWRGETGIKFRTNPVPISLGISRLRDFLRSPFAWDMSRLQIDPKCEGLIWELQEGEQYPKDAEGNPIREYPLDANNHSRKALSYFLIDAYGRGDGDVDWSSSTGYDRFKPVMQHGDKATIGIMLDRETGAMKIGTVIRPQNKVMRRKGLRFS